MAKLPYPLRFAFDFGRFSNYYDPTTCPALLLGETQEGKVPFELLSSDRAAHMYMCGISGSGKTRFLENMIIQDIILGQPICVIDPTGNLYQSVLEFIAHATEKAVKNGNSEKDILERYLFMDINSDHNSVRINPLEPNYYETTEEQVGDLLKVTERLFGDLREMRRLSSIISTSMTAVIELNKRFMDTPEDQLPPEIKGQNVVFPLNIDFLVKFLLFPDQLRQTIIGLLPETDDLHFVRTYWTRFFPEFNGSQQAERLESSINILRHFTGSQLVRMLFGTNKSTCFIPELLQKKKSLFCSIPLGKDTLGGQLIGAYIATKYQRCAYRRPSHLRQPYILYIDEFHEFCDIDFAKAAVTLRQYQLFLVTAHQSQRQPPFHTDEGRSILDTIKANSRIRVLFQLAREDAETMSKEFFAMTQQHLHLTYYEKSLSSTESESTSKVTSYQRTTGSTFGWSRTDSVALAITDSYGVALSEGINIGETLTEGFGDVIDEGISHTISDTTGETVTETVSKTEGIAVMVGKNWAHVVNKTNGLSFSMTDKESLATQNSTARSQSNSEQTGNTRTTGDNFQVTDNQGSSVTHNNGRSAHHQIRGVDSSSTSSGDAVGRMNSHAVSNGKSFSDAIQTIRGVTNGVTQTLGETRTRGTDRGETRNESTTEGDTQGGSNSETKSSSTTVSKARAQLRSHTDAHGKTLNLSHNQTKSLATAFQKLHQFTENYSRALQESITAARGMSVSHTDSFSTGESFSEDIGRSSSEGINEKKMYLSLDGEREISINDLQRLNKQQCVITKDALCPVFLNSFTISDEFYRKKCLPKLGQVG